MYEIFQLPRAVAQQVASAVVVAGEVADARWHRSRYSG